MSDSKKLITHNGGCHCGLVRYEVLAPSSVVVFDCNCSVCTKKQNKHFIVPSGRFTLTQGQENLKTYTFGTHKAKHLFCEVCGVQSFYYPRSNPDGVGIMPHCIDKGTLEELVIKEFDGQNWEESMANFPQIKKYSQLNVE